MLPVFIIFPFLYFFLYYLMEQFCSYRCWNTIVICLFSHISLPADTKNVEYIMDIFVFSLMFYLRLYLLSFNYICIYMRTWMLFIYDNNVFVCIRATQICLMKDVFLMSWFMKVLWGVSFLLASKENKQYVKNQPTKTQF